VEGEVVGVDEEGSRSEEAAGGTHCGEAGGVARREKRDLGGRVSVTVEAVTDGEGGETRFAARAGLGTGDGTVRI
jgi:hypothetical protein